MCDPVTIGIGVLGAAVGSKMARGSTPKAAAQPDPAAERAAAEAEAAQAANARLAADQKRRREQGSLLAKGAPTFTLGDTGTTDPASPISNGVSRSTTARSASLMSRGATVGGAATPIVYGGSGLRVGGASRMLQ